jgi:hypothetical protein
MWIYTPTPPYAFNFTFKKGQDGNCKVIRQPYLYVMYDKEFLQRESELQLCWYQYSGFMHCPNFSYLAQVRKYTRSVAAQEPWFTFKPVISTEELYWAKMCFIMRCKHFIFAPINTQRITFKSRSRFPKKGACMFSYKSPLFVSHFNKNWNESANFSETPRYQN